LSKVFLVGRSRLSCATATRSTQKPVSGLVVGDALDQPGEGPAVLGGGKGGHGFTMPHHRRGRHARAGVVELRRSG
jgi:hypothetical protein